VNCGIYAIEHVESGKMYVGSAIDFKARWRVHLCLLNKGTHHCAHLQAAWAKYGKVAFLFRKLLVCSPENLVMYEQRCIDGYKVCDREFGYNAAPVAGSQTGYKHSPETRAKIKAKRALQTFTAEQRANLWSPERLAKHISTYGSKSSPSQIEARAKKLSFELAKDIIDMYSKSRHTQKELGEKFGVSAAMISRVVSGKSWATR